PLQVTEIAEYNRKRQAEIDERRTMRIPAEEPDEMDLGEAWNVLAERRRDAVIQPPKPPIPAADAILERAAEREAEACHCRGASWGVTSAKRGDNRDRIHHRTGQGPHRPLPRLQRNPRPGLP